MITRFSAAPCILGDACICLLVNHFDIIEAADPQTIPIHVQFKQLWTSDARHPI
jgi:hypothetical protein